jgi:Protein of unknown function (DUF3485)
MMKLLPLAVASAVFLLAGYLHGVWSQRWTSSADEAACAARFQAIPMNIGEWEGSTAPMQKEDPYWTEDNCLLRRYRHSVSSESVLVGIWYVPILDPIRTHDPTICYPFFGWAPVPVSEPRYDAKEAAGPGKRATFGVAQFKKNEGVAAKELLVYWSWSVNGNWSVPKGDLRLAFPEHRKLYKFYVLQDLPPEGAPGRAPRAPEFLKTFMPVMNKALFEDPPPALRAGL